MIESASFRLPTSHRIVLIWFGVMQVTAFSAEWRLHRASSIPYRAGSQYWPSELFSLNAQWQTQLLFLALGDL
jgi:hypothetical protein